jgi:hypothetical protein
MTDIICPLCGKPNPPEQAECLYCQAPLKSSVFLAPFTPEGEEDQQIPAPEKPAERMPQTAQPDSTSSLEQAIPDWLKETEANFLEPTKTKPFTTEPEDLGPDQVSEQIDSLLKQPSTSPAEKEPTVDDDWLSSLLEEAGLNEPSTATPSEEPRAGIGEAVDKEIAESSIEGTAEEEQPSPPVPAEKPEWLSELEASSTIKLEGGIPPAEISDKGSDVSKTEETKGSEEEAVPEWVGKPSSEEAPPASKEPGAPIAPAELPGWLEALRPTEAVSPSEPVEDLSAADIVTAGPLVGLRGVISAHPSAIRARKPPTYSIKLRVTDEQRARVEMMEELLANEQKPRPLPSKPIITSRNISRLVIALALVLPIVWMIITGSQRIPPPQPGNIPGVVDFTQQIQSLPAGAPVLLAFDYEAGFSGEMNTAISTLISQLMIKNIFMTLVTTTPSGPALAESLIGSTTSMQGEPGSYLNYTDLGYIPGGTLGLIGLATSPKAVVPYSLDGNNVWEAAPLNTISVINDFSAVIVLTNDSATARSWIEQVGPFLWQDGTPLLIITSAQAEPLILPFYLAAPAQVQGLVTGIVGGLAYARTVGNIQQNGSWDALSIGVTVSVLIIVVGSMIGVVAKMRTSGSKKEG